ncbi:3'(2'),5'-bisphosphate nucleotidase CysQ [Thalassotalea sp. HSM 43]|uniref:3'(2'),5'-bisphosphate nucleotidase CysQ n=1 Tax=Thalassotalea sp. HSM 43 TaxID=2552945 RepID=UPI0010820B46|nr:3'(2'),5'-bisphosphate nucleotidase CysQ [Thalassotalea sp. HSM 43]QBY04013.1 3'(2'),5'-bisphosphate nucleotidase CysQ [Thalassotalea sp. HSM 43]
MKQSMLLEIAIKLAKLAGEDVMRFYQQGNFEEYHKADDSPVTSADLAANKLLVDELTRLTPDIPIISEESTNIEFQQRRNWPRYWLLDPIDGTGEFIAGSGDFAVNIALVENNWPVIGVIHAPAHGVTYYASKGAGAFKDDGKHVNAIQVADYDGSRALNVGVSRRQNVAVIEQYLSKDYSYQHIPLGSCSLKSCQIAEGSTDCYLRIGPTGEWDTGASQIILQEAGGNIVDSEMNELSYNRRESLMNPDFIGLGNAKIDWQHVIIPHRCSRDY